MSLNAGIAISRNTDQILQIIQRECANATNWWRREHEGQQRYIQTLRDDCSQVRAEKSAAIAEATKAKDQVERYKAELQQRKQEGGSHWETEARRYKDKAQRYKDEAQSWKLKYEAAIKGRDNAMQQLSQTQARFSVTLVPLSPTESSLRVNHPPGSMAETPMKSTGSSVASNPSCNGPVTPPNSVPSPGSKRRKISMSTISRPIRATAVTDGSYPGAGDTENARQARKPTPGSKSQIVEPPNNLGDNGPGATSTLDATRFPAESTSTDAQITTHGLKKWCYCDCVEYGEMIMCNNSDCPKQWFHISCTGLKCIPQGDWLCTYCTTQSSPSQVMTPLDTPLHESRNF